MRFSLNSTLTGCILGLLAPVLGVMAYFLLLFKSRMNLAEFFNSIFVLGLFSHVLAIGVYVSNLALFFLFIKTDKLLAAKGVLLSTIIYSFFIVIFRVGL